MLNHSRNDSSFNSAECDALAEEDRLEARRSYSSEDDHETTIVKRKGPICYFVMNFAKYGELFRLVEINSERFTEPVVRYLFK